MEFLDKFDWAVLCQDYMVFNIQHQDASKKIGNVSNQS
jgi:hypothetical protein